MAKGKLKRHTYTSLFTPFLFCCQETCPNHQRKFFVSPLFLWRNVTKPLSKNNRERWQEENKNDKMNKRMIMTILMSTIEWWFALGGVFLLGLQTSISPCPISTDIVALSFLSRKVSRPQEIFLSGILYALGRTFTYIFLAILILSALFWSGDALLRFLQTTLHAYLGPALILAGMMLLGLFSFPIGTLRGEKMQCWADTLGLWSALPLGGVFALAFCPTSAATFLATITLSSQCQSYVLFPMVFGIGTAIPILFFTGIIALQAGWLGKTFSVLSQIDGWMRGVAGTVFILFGIWLSIRYVWTGA